MADRNKLHPGKGGQAHWAAVRAMDPPRLGVSEEGIEKAEDVRPEPEFSVSPDRPIAFEYDFIEVYAGSARVSKAALLLGLVVGPPIDTSYSGELDLGLTRYAGKLQAQERYGGAGLHFFFFDEKASFEIKDGALWF